MNGLYVLGPMIHDTSKFIVNQIKDDCLKLSLNLVSKYFFRVPLNCSQGIHFTTWYTLPASFAVY